MSRQNKKFVIQEHLSGSDVHWDFMLESGGILQTYRLDKALSEALHLAVNATKIFDHPLKFLTYQGPVNKGQGSVRIIETGTYRIVHQAHDRIELDLNGKILKGNFTLTHIEGDNWQFAPDTGNSKQA
jgi:bifunctional non-homologous end joining protein LigD